ncbi:MAG: hypothetical protein ACJ8NS_07295 [Chthoniobacterales bacterium]
MNVPSRLLDLAKIRFAPRTITGAEEKLFLDAEAGRKVDAKVDKANPTKEIVSSEYVVWLCTDRSARDLVTHRGFQISNVQVEGVLDLDDAQIPFPFKAVHCTFNGDICLERARLPSLTLINCSVRNIKAAGIHIEGEAELNEGFIANGEVCFVAATIDGALDFQGASLHNPKGVSLFANRAKIGGSLYLRRNFHSTGEINLTRATIGSNLDLGDAQISNTGGEALSATSTEIFGNVLLRRACVTGAANFMAAKVHGFVDCEGAEFNHPITKNPDLEFDGRALIANSAKIDGSVMLSDGFTAQGTLEFDKAEIGGILECTNARLRQGEGAELNLEQASAAAWRDDEDSWPKSGKLRLDGFTYKRIYGKSGSSDVHVRLAWLELQAAGKFLPQPYEQLAATLRNMGHEAQARMVMIEKNKAYAKFLRKHFTAQPGKPWRPFTRLRRQEWWWYNAFGKLIGYGYKPWRAFGLSVLVILFGTFLLHEGYKHRLILPTHKDAYEKAVAGVPGVSAKPRLAPDYPRFNSFAYSIESFIPLLKFDQVSNWAPNGNQGEKSFMSAKGGSLLWGYLCLQIVLGWILTSLWVGALTGLLKT